MDFREISEARREELKLAAASVVRGGIESKLRLSPMGLWKLGSPSGEVRFVLLEAQVELIMMPGSTAICLSALDEHGKVLSTRTFRTDYRTYFVDARLRRDIDHMPPVVELRVHGGSANGPYCYEYYGLVEDAPVLVRYQWPDGKGYRIGYCGRSAKVGPDVPARSADRWEELLRSDDVLEVLHALLWLAGYHMRPGDVSIEGIDDSRRAEVKEQAELVDALRNRRSVRSKIKELSRSRNAWVGETARSVLAGSGDGGSSRDASRENPTPDRTTGDD